MTFSINTNVGQMSAVRALNDTLRSLGQTEVRVSTGLAVSSAKDNASAYAIAQNTRAQIGAYGALEDVRNRTLGLLDVTLAASESISDILIEMKQLAVAAADPSLSDESRAALDTHYQALKRQIDLAAKSATFGGLNLIDSSGSNFMNYGPGAAAVPIEWGSPPRTVGEPLAGEPLTLRFGFEGAGQQFERIDGTVSFKLRYLDGGTWTTVGLDTQTIPSGTTITPGAPAYVVEGSAAMPAIPDTASQVQLFAEYSGIYPSPDGRDVNDTLANGSPGTSGDLPHLIMQWGERDWTNGSPSIVDQGAGFRLRTEPGAPYLQSTEPGTALTGSVRLEAPGPGIDEAGFDYQVHYEVFDHSSGSWVRLASSPSYNVAPGAVADPTDLPYDLTIPAIPSGNRDFTQARLYAEMTVSHDGSAVATPSVSTQVQSTVTTSNITLDTSTVGGGPESTFLNALGRSGNRLQADIGIVSSATPGEPFDAQADYILRWNDGSTWHETTIRSDPSIESADGSPVSVHLATPLPSVAGPVVQAEIVARVHLTHDPDGAAATEDHDITLMSWDGTTLTSHGLASVLATANNATTTYPVTRNIETVTKVEVLNDIKGGSTPIREKNTKTNGLLGLGLADTTLADMTAAQEALDAVGSAQETVLRNLQYYGARSKLFDALKTFESKLKGELNGSVGQLVDADLAVESARLQALQVKEQLGAQALSIANGFPKLVLSLFR